MLNNTALIILSCSLLVVGCKCNDPDGSSNVPVVYDVSCYNNGNLILDITTTSKPTVNGSNTYWRDDDTGELVDLTADCTVIPRRSNQPKAHLINNDNPTTNGEY